MKPNRERIQAWIAALRSGKYQQGRYCLRRSDNKYCCLGVASDISQMGEWVLDDRKETYHYAPDTENLRSSSNALLIKEVATYFGLKNPNPLITSVNQKLCTLNDKDYTFNQIADILEKEFITNETK